MLRLVCDNCRSSAKHLTDRNQLLCGECFIEWRNSDKTGGDLHIVIDSRYSNYAQIIEYIEKRNRLTGISFWHQYRKK